MRWASVIQIAQPRTATTQGDEMKDTDGVSTKNESGDRSFFTIVPRVVWAFCEDPYDFILWAVIKDIAGEDGTCILNVRQLSVLTMMSVGKIIQCRDRLIKNGLLKGELKRDTGFQKDVWHFTVPNLWEKNIAWTKGHMRISDRIEWKRRMAANKRLLESGPEESGLECPDSEDIEVSPQKLGHYRCPEPPGKDNFRAAEEIWNKVVDLLCEDIGRGGRGTSVTRIFETAIYGIRPIFDNEKDTMLLVSVDDYQASFISSRYLSTIKSKIVGILGKQVDVSVVPQHRLSKAAGD